ncbi:FAD-dependent monooxygenase [bacterium]|nr:FAD-dependent monooxygenase [bacterium]
MGNKKNVAIAGAGLVGSLLAIYLLRRGYGVTLFEKRPDMRKQDVGGGRSINLALSNRGLKALHAVGLDDVIRKTAIPMHGRMVHSIEGELNMQPYGKEGQFINSISRSGLNIVLMDEAERVGAKILFDCKVEDVDWKNTQIKYSHQLVASGQEVSQFDLIIGADGAFSEVRNALRISDRFDYSQNYIEHGYKELSILPGEGGKFLMEKNALHIWPRESFMLIALPNHDGSFTCTLFVPFEVPLSFDTIQSKDDAHAFFQKYFPDAVPLMPTLFDDFVSNPSSSLVTIHSWPWHKNNTFLIGDAAHGIVPFFGQGMNAGFEDCRVLNDLLDAFHDNWRNVLPEFQSLRKPDTDAIAQLALDNFIEMRDLVTDPEFLLRKKIEARLHQLYPDQWIPLYSMVTFNENIRYSEALRIGHKQAAIMKEVLKQPAIESNWQTLDYKAIVAQL